MKEEKKKSEQEFLELEDYNDGDNLVCIKCDRFISHININKLCDFCSIEETNLEEKEDFENEY